MKVESLYLVNFRNYEKINIDFFDNIFHFNLKITTFFHNTILAQIIRNFKILTTLYFLLDKSFSNDYNFNVKTMMKE